MTSAALTERGLAMQGFPIRTDPVVRRVQPWLRLTPSLSTAWIASGTVLGSPGVLLGFSLVSAFAASQHKHPFDRLYNRWIRRVTKSERLPDNPPPRRFAMGLAAAWAMTAATLFATGHRRAGFVAGGLLTAAGATVATTHFCVGSWVFRQLERLRTHKRAVSFERRAPNG
jgi:hypothetical protein